MLEMFEIIVNALQSLLDSTGTLIVHADTYQYFDGANFNFRVFRYFLEVKDHSVLG